MDVQKVLVELRAYRTQLDETIGVLDRLAHRRGEKRGRPLEMPAMSERDVAKKPKKRRMPRRKPASV